MALLIAASVWSFSTAMRQVASEPSAQFAWMWLENAGFSAIPITWLVFSAQYTRRDRLLTPARITLLSIEPLVFLALAATNASHLEVWQRITFPAAGAAAIELVFGPAWYAHAVFSYALILIALLCLGLSYHQARRGQRLPYGLLILCAVFPATTSILYILGRSPLPPYDVTPVVFTFSILLFLWVSRRYWLVDLVPLGRSAILHHMRESALVLDIQNRVIELNQAAAQLLGKDPGEIMLKPVEEALSGWADWKLPRLEEESTLTVKEIVVGSGAARRWFEQRISPLYNSRNILVGRLLVWSEVTRRRLMTDALREREARLRLLTSQMPAILWSTDLNLQVTSFLGAHLAELNLSAETVVGRTIFELDQTNQKTILSGHQRALRGETAALAGAYYGRAIQASIEPLRDSSGQICGTVGLAQDVTERKHSEVALRRRLDELTLLHGVATACSQAASQAELLERVSGLIGAARGFEGFKLRMVEDGQLPRPQEETQQSAPLISGGRVVAELSRAAVPGASFDSEEERLLMTLAGQIGPAIERLRIQGDERRRINELQSLTRLGQEVTAMLDLQQVLDSVVRTAAELLHSDASGLYVYHEDRRAYLLAAHGVGPRLIEKVNAGGLILEGTALGRAILSGRPYQVPDVSQEPGYSASEITDIEHIRSILAIPMLRGAEVVGGIVLWHRQVRVFSQEEEMLLEALAQHSVNAVVNARLFAGEREQRRLAELLRASGEALSASLDLETILDRLLVEVELLAPYDAATLFVMEGDQCRVVRTRGYERFDPHLAAQTIGQKVVIQLVDEPERTPAIIADIHAHDAWRPLGPAEFVKSWIGVPVVAGSQVAAFVSLMKIEPGYYTQQHAERLAVFAGQAGLAIQNARLFAEAGQRLRESTLLGRVISLTAAAADLHTALTQVAAEVAVYFDVPQAAFALITPNGAEAVVSAEYRGPGRGSALGARIPIAGNPSMAYVLAHKKPLAIADAQTDSLLAPIHELMRSREAASIILVPLLIGDRVAGTFGMDTLQRREYTPAEIELLESVARHAGQVLDRLQLFETARQQAGQMARLAELSANLSRSFTLAEVARSIGEGALHLSRADQVAVFFNSAGSQVSCAWHSGLQPDFISAVVRALQQPEQSDFLARVDPLVIADVCATGSLADWSRLACRAGLRSLAIWPLVYEGSPVAMVTCFAHAPQHWLRSRGEVMEAFVRQASVALQNARLFDETRRRAAQQEALNAITAAAVVASNLEDLLAAALPPTLQALGLEQGIIWMGDKTFSMGLRDGCCQSVLRDLTAAGAISDWSAPGMQRLHTPDGVAPSEQMCASLSFPIRASGAPAGGLLVFSPQPRPWLAEEVALVETAGRQIGSAVERLDLLAKTQAQARQMQQIVDTVPEGVLLLDSQYHVVLANPAAREMLASLSDSAPTLIHLAGRPLAELLAAPPGQPWIELESAGEPRRVFEVAARPLSAAQASEGWVLVLRDVSHEREDQARIQMQERLATVGQLAAGIAHDFNNIMAAIVVYADLLSLDAGMNSASRERLETIQQQVQRATSLIRQILDFSRRAVMEPSSLDLLPFIKELDKLLARVLPESIRIELYYSPGVYLAHADPTRLQQVFINLALNARDAMPTGGVLRFELDRLLLEPGLPSPLPDLTPGAWIRIAVQDSGCGISGEILPHIFDPFFTTKPVGQGTGLGLAQVYGIIKQHGGSVDVHSQPGQGARFTLYLPALEAPGEEEGPSAWQENISGRGETILIVEDDRIAREAFEAVLETQNYRVLSADNGRAALEIYDQLGRHIDLVISDVVMPEMGGLALYEKLKQRQPQLRMLFITGHPLDEGNQDLLEAGGVAWLQKPFSVSELCENVHKCLRG